MRAEILNFIKEACRTYNLNALYIPENDTYFIHKRGRAVQSFDTLTFYQLPKRYRLFMIRPLLKVGLAHNLGERYKDGIFGRYKFGKKIF